MAQFAPRELSWTEQDEEMYALLIGNKSDSAPLAALQREHDRRDK